MKQAAVHDMLMRLNLSGPGPDRARSGREHLGALRITAAPNRPYLASSGGADLPRRAGSRFGNGL